MSDHYLFHFNFDLSPDAPAPLLRSLDILAKGGTPGEADTEGLPGIVREYLMSGGVPGDGVYLFEKSEPMRMTSDGEAEADPSKAHLTRYSLRMARTFHDDEYFNGGMFWPYWLFQFAASDGPLATNQQTNGGDIPSVISKFGDRLIETHFAYNPLEYDLSGRLPPGKENPVVISRTTDMSLSETLEGLQIFADGFDFG